MIRTRASATVAFATVLASSTLSAMVAAPIANADVLSDIRGPVNGVRAGSVCGPLNYSIALEGEAQARTGNILPGVPPTGQYKGSFTSFKGRSDPASEATRNAVANASGAINDCKNKDFGVGFFRDDSEELDFVVIVLGVPEAPKPADVPVQCPPGSTNPTVPAGQQCVALPVSKPPITCPEGSPTPTVPAGGACAPVPTAPKNAVRVTFTRGLPSWTVNVTNSADIAGSCTYDASGGIGADLADQSFDIGPKGTASFSVPAPALLQKYTITTSCRGDFLGKNVEFGHDVQTVSQ